MLILTIHKNEKILFVNENDDCSQIELAMVKQNGAYRMFLTLPDHIKVRRVADENN